MVYIHIICLLYEYKCTSNCKQHACIVYIRIFAGGGGNV